MAKSTYTQAAARLKMDRIAEMLNGEEMIWTQVADKLHVHKQTASRYLWHMAEQCPRRIYVCEWIEDEVSSRKIPVFTAGSKPNKRKPKPLTAAEVYKRIQADPLRYAARKEKYRATWHRSKGRETVPPRPAANPFSVLLGRGRAQSIQPMKEAA